MYVKIFQPKKIQHVFFFFKHLKVDFILYTIFSNIINGKLVLFIILNFYLFGGGNNLFCQL